MGLQDAKVPRLFGACHACGRSKPQALRLSLTPVRMDECASCAGGDEALSAGSSIVHFAPQRRRAVPAPLPISGESQLVVVYGCGFDNIASTMFLQYVQYCLEWLGASG
jgi:hypothetical protein